jgi:ribosomal protein S18 acetylase RimI-like enzyme
VWSTYAARAARTPRVTCAAVARILIVGGGCRGRQLAAQVSADGHAVRITTRSEQRRVQIEEVGAECWPGDPDRLATLRGALDSVTIACWLLGSASGSAQQLQALHDERLAYFLMQMIDTTVRGFVYEARGTSVAPALLDAGAARVRAHGLHNAIPTALLDVDPTDTAAWLAQAQREIDGLLTRA